MSLQLDMQNAKSQFARRGIEEKTTFMLQEFFDSVYRPLRLRDGSFRTTKLYNQLIKRYSEFLGHQATIDDFDDLKISAFLVHRRDAGKSPWTIDRERSGLLALWRFAARRGLVARWPEVQRGKIPQRSPEAWTEGEMHRLFATAASTKGWIGGTRAKVWWPALLLTLWETGERISGIMSARQSDFRPPHLLIRAEGRKGGRRDRIFTLTDKTCELITAAMIPGEELVFLWEGSPANLWGAWRRLVQRAGLSISRGNGFHKIRRSAASYYASKGGDATAFLGHDSDRLAKQWYLDPTIVNAGKPAPCDVLPRID